MYKTVRHGENSLQYTILPQDGDEESGKPMKRKRGCCRPRTVLFLVLTALLVGVVTASVAVPLLLTTDLLSLPGAAFPFSRPRPHHNATHRHVSTTVQSFSTTPEEPTSTASVNDTSPPPSTIESVSLVITTPPTTPAKREEWPRWLFTDPSSYLQWRGYNRDGLLLPIILGSVVVPATLAICFIIIRRRRRQKDQRRETIGKIASDLQYGDKATLLADASEEE